jgi:CRP-like cAMP-binding protein
MTTFDILNVLKELPLFSVCDQALLQEALSSDGVHLVTVEAGASPAPCYDDMLGVVLSGKLQILSADKQNPVVLHAVNAGHVFGAASLFLERATPVSRLLAQSKCQLFYLSRDAVRTLLHKDHRFMDAYLQFLAERVQFLNAKIRSFTAGSTERRLALWLAEHAQDGTVRALSLSTLAESLDIGRASLYRALDKMEDSGLIARNGRKITVPDTEKLLKHYQT